MGSMASAVLTYGDQRLGLSYRSTAAENPASGYQGGGEAFGTTSSLTGIPTPRFGKMSFKGWVVITGVEFALLGMCGALPRSFTGRSENMADEVLDNLAVACTEPPVWITTIGPSITSGTPTAARSTTTPCGARQASFLESFLFSTALSFQWEKHIIEAVAEPPSTQDLLFTSTTGALLGEAIHITTNHIKRNGTNIFEKAFILVFNPTSVLFTGFN